MLKPIVITEFGNTIKGNHCGLGETAGHNDDDHTTFGSIEHDKCGGFLRRRANSATFDVLKCSDCHVFVNIPPNVRTFGELRKYFHQFNLEPVLETPKVRHRWPKRLAVFITSGIPRLLAHLRPAQADPPQSVS
jgi:hypothetical protein